ncbi:MAG: hypothetical protein EOP36_12450 [Rubrivivax sp.]|nr:MAG: hypothetical protein EOP36_12450 [Rubrivivax sp.]
MTHADAIADQAGQGPLVLGQGLLGTTSQWHLPLGVTQAMPLRWAARVLLALAAAMLLVWAGALAAQALSGQGPWGEPVVALVVGLPWCVMSFHLWQRLESFAMVPLRWGGLPPSSRPNQGPTVARPGWSVPGWPHAVSVHVVFDLDPWVLVKMVSQGRGFRAQAWCWVDARIGFQGMAGHHLRALLFSTRANEVGRDQAGPAEGSAVMASSRDIQRQWSNLLSSFKTIGRDVGISAIRPEMGARGHATADSDFATTVILDRPHRALRGRGPLRQARRGGRS